MRRIPSLVGKRFGMLLVVEQSVKELNGRKQSVCLCRCDCGNEIEVAASNLQKKDGTAPISPTRSCGCVRTLGDLTGKRFGRLTVLERAETSAKGERTWRCRCDCGGEKTVSGSQLKSGFVTSCGCARKEANANMAKLAKKASAAGHTPEVEAKRTATAFGAPGSPERAARGKALRNSLIETGVIGEHSNYAKIVATEPEGNNPYRGVCWNKRKRRWMAYCRVNGVLWQKSGFDTPEAAKEARDKKQAELLILTGAEKGADNYRNRRKKKP